MEVSKRAMDGFQKTLIGLGVVFAIVFLPTLVFLVVGNQVAAAVCGTFTVAIILAFTHVLSFAGGAWYTRGSMQMGAELVTRAQETNDRWDERKTAVLGRVLGEGVRLGQRVGNTDVAPLPLPSQGMDWLPPVAVFQDDDEPAYLQDGR